MLVVGNGLPDARNIIVSGRIHPGESNGSWMMHGFLDFATSPKPNAAEFRNMYPIK